MATFEEIANKNSASSALSANTGKLGNQLRFGTPLGFIAFERGTRVLKTDNADLAYFNNLIATRKMIPAMEATAFEPLSSEDTMSTTSAGVETLSLRGLAKMRFTFQEGHEFYREIEKLRGYKNIEIGLVDEESNIMLATDSNGDFKGFETGLVNPEMTRFKVQGGDAEAKPIVFQLLRPKELSEDYKIFTAAELGFDAQEDLRGVNSASCVFTDIPSEGGSQISFKVVLDSDMNTVVGGLTSPSELDFIYSGVPEALVAVTETATPGNYTADIGGTFSAGDNLKLALKGVVTVSDVLYAKGEYAEVEVIS